MADLTSDFPSILSTLMEKPELIAKIASLLRGSGITLPEKAEDEEPQNAEPTAAPAPVEPTFRPVDEKSREKLFLSLKPYLSDKRASAIDTMVGILRVIDAVRPGR